MPKKIDLIGHKYGRLTVINEAPRYTMKSGDSKVMWNCICECGNTSVVAANNLRSGTTTSCGCFQKENQSKIISERNREYNRYDIKDDYVIVYDSNNNYFYIDLDDLDKIREYYWYIFSHKKSERYVVSNTKNRKRIRLHRFILNLSEDNTKVIDHINHNTLDNRKNNLRIVSQGQNCFNHEKLKNNTSGATGVSWLAKLNKWQAYITFNHKCKYLGIYTNFDDAVAARKAAEEKYFGEYSYDNSMRIAEQIKIG